MLTKKTLTSFVLAAGLAATAAAAPAAAPYRVVINTANPTSTLSRDEVGRIFLKKTTTWSGGTPAVPIDQSMVSAVRKAFSQGIFGKDIGAIESYWQQAIFTGRGVPPFVKGSDAEVLAFVRATAGAVGYVSGSGDLGASIKELEVK